MSRDFIWPEQTRIHGVVISIRIKVLAEFDCFVHAFKRLTSTVPKEQLVCAIPAKAKEESERIMKLVKDWLKNVDSSMMEGSLPHMAEGGDTVETEDDTHLPCMLVMSGSGAAIMHVCSALYIRVTSMVLLARGDQMTEDGYTAYHL